jgi:hypothetical protein
MIPGLFKYITIYVKVFVIRKKVGKHEKYKNGTLVIVNSDHLIYELSFTSYLACHKH